DPRPGSAGEAEADGLAVDAGPVLVAPVEGQLGGGALDVVEPVPERPRLLDRGLEGDGAELRPDVVALDDDAVAGGLRQSLPTPVGERGGADGAGVLGQQGRVGP